MAATLDSAGNATLVIDPYLWSVEEYDALFTAGIFDEDSKVELLSGIITKKMGNGSVHDYILGHLLAIILKAIGASNTVRSQSTVLLPDSKPEPDIWVSLMGADAHRNALATAADLALVIEVADSSRTKDFTTKLPMYARAGIPEYWIIDVETETLHVLTQPTAEEKYAIGSTYKRGDTIVHALVGEVVLAEILGET